MRISLVTQGEYIDTLLAVSGATTVFVSLVIVRQRSAGYARTVGVTDGETKDILR